MKTPFALLLLFLSPITFAQQFNISVSEPMRYEGDSPVKMGEDYFAIDADAKTQFGFTFKMSKVKLSIKLFKYNNALQVVKEAKLSNGERVYGPFKPMLRIISDKLYLLYYQMAEEEYIKLLASEIDPSGLSLNDPVELLAIQQKNVGLQQVMDLFSSNKFEFVSSPDGSKQLALWSSGINNRLFFSVFDKNFKKLRSAEETIKGENKIVVNNACVDNNGNVIISFNADKRTHLLCSRPETKNTVQAIMFSSGTAYEAFVLPPISNNKDFRVAGTYKEGKDNLTGIFYQTVSGSEFRLSAPEKTPFPSVLVEQCSNDGWGSTKAKNYGLSEIKLRPFSLPDGNIDLVGEFRRTELGTRTSFIISGNIVNIHFKKDNVVCSRIPKARVSAGSTIGDSYNAVPYKNGIVIFYNDHLSNVKKDITASPDRSDNYTNSVLVAATIADNNTVKRDVLVDLSQQNYLPVAEDLQRLSSAILVPIRRLKGFGKVTEDFKWGTITIQ